MSYECVKTYEFTAQQLRQNDVKKFDQQQTEGKMNQPTATRREELVDLFRRYRAGDMSAGNDIGGLVRKFMNETDEKNYAKIYNALRAEARETVRQSETLQYARYPERTLEQE